MNWQLNGFGESNISHFQVEFYLSLLFLEQLQCSLLISGWRCHEKQLIVQAADAQEGRPMTTESQQIKKGKGLQSSNRFRRRTTDKRRATGSTIYGRDYVNQLQPHTRTIKKLIDGSESADSLNTTL